MKNQIITVKFTTDAQYYGMFMSHDEILDLLEFREQHMRNFIEKEFPEAEIRVRFRSYGHSFIEVLGDEYVEDEKTIKDICEEELKHSYSAAYNAWTKIA